MDFILAVLLPVVILTVIALLLGFLTVLAGKKFEIKTDEKTEKIYKSLPGADCGACGFAGCHDYAAAVAKGEKTDTCTVGGYETAEALSKITGVRSEPEVRMRAQVMCSGTTSLSRRKYDYLGLADCHSVSRLGNGPKECPYACIGLGTCVKACPFNAIKVENGVAVVEYEKCRGCGLCAEVCPQKIIKMSPFDRGIWVGCSSRDKGYLVRSFCKVGCTGCNICVDACPEGAISVKRNLAVIDYGKCTDCGECAAVCPRHIIRSGAEQISNGDTIKDSSVSENFTKTPKTRAERFSDRNGFGNDN